MSLFDTSLSLHRLDINNICAGRIFQLSFGASGVGGETRLKARLQMREKDGIHFKPVVPVCRTSYDMVHRRR